MGEEGAEVVSARGHEHVSATHESTFEVTSDDYLTPAGDCILGIEADRVPAEFDDAFVAICQNADTTMVAEISAAGETAQICGRGHPDLTFADARSCVVRTSTYVDDRTVMVAADAAAADLDRSLVAVLASGASVTLRLRAFRA